MRPPEHCDAFPDAARRGVHSRKLALSAMCDLPTPYEMQPYKSGVNKRLEPWRLEPKLKKIGHGYGMAPNPQNFPPERRRWVNCLEPKRCAFPCLHEMLFTFVNKTH